MEEERYKLDKGKLIDLFFDSVHLMILHYGLWFRETEHQIGLDKAIMADEIAWKQILSTSLRRIAKRLNIPMKDDTIEFMANLSKEDLVGLLEDMGKNWLAFCNARRKSFFVKLLDALTPDASEVLVLVTYPISSQNSFSVNPPRANKCCNSFLGMSCAVGMFIGVCK